MPKQIKKEQIKKSELLYRKWSVAGLAAATVFMGCIGAAPRRFSGAAHRCGRRPAAGPAFRLPAS